MRPVALKGRSAMRLEHLVLSNGNIFLPLSNLTQAQRWALDAETWSQAAAAADSLAPGRRHGRQPRSPRRARLVIPRSRLLPRFSRYGDGIEVLHEGIQYLVERSKDEQRWLTALAEAPFPVTVIWGLYDTVSPPRVASYVWNEYLMLKPGGNRLYFIPDANHYLQVDRPDAFVKVLLPRARTRRRSGTWRP